MSEAVDRGIVGVEEWQAPMSASFFTGAPSLSFQYVDFTNDSEEFVSSLGAASNVAELYLLRCIDSSQTRNIAAAIQCNTSIESLLLDDAIDDFAYPIFRGLALAASSGQSSLKSLFYESDDVRQATHVLQALQEFLKIDGSTLQHLELGSGVYNAVALSHILQGLIESKTVTEVSFRYWQFYDFEDDEDNIDEEEEEEEEQNDEEYKCGLLLANFLRSKLNLSKLRLEGCEIFHLQPFAYAIAEMLTRHEYPLQCFALDINSLNVLENDVTHFCLSIDDFRSLMTSVCRSTGLEHFMFKFNAVRPEADQYFQVFEEAIPSLKGKGLTFSCEDGFRSDHNDYDDRFFDALKNNYNIESVNHAWLNETYEGRLQFIYNRNRRLKQWVANPELVPRDLWPEAMKLALEAGKESLYLSLLALSGEGIGLPRKGSRKRKRGT